LYGPFLTADPLAGLIYCVNCC